MRALLYALTATLTLAVSPDLRTDDRPADSPLPETYSEDFWTLQALVETGGGPMRGLPPEAPRAL